MSVASLINTINSASGAEIPYQPYDFSNVSVLVGTPPLKITGLQYILSRHNAPQTTLVMSLTGGGVFLGNHNMSGIIELGILSGTVSGAAIQMINLAGIPFPVAITDDASGGTSTVLASGCRRVGTPEWRRSAVTGIDIYTFETPRLLLSDGLLLIETA
jgi:hypothetical protein